MSASEQDGRNDQFGEEYWTRHSAYGRFTDFASARTALYEWYRGLFADHQRALAAHYPLLDPLVELGTGHGGALDRLRHAGLHPLGFDLSTHMLANLRATDRDLPLVAADGRMLPIRSASLAAVVAFEVLEHVPTPARALGEIHRCLRPGGVLLAATPNPRGDIVPLHSSRSDPTHVSVQRAEQWSALARREGSGE